MSQFTLYGDARGQRRPSFVAAGRHLNKQKSMYEEFAEALRKLGLTVATGVFGAMMSVELVNEGPVTILWTLQDVLNSRNCLTNYGLYFNCHSERSG